MLSTPLYRVANLEEKDGAEEREADAVRQNDDGVSLQDAVDDPERDAGAQDQEHLERDVVRLAGRPDLPDLRDVGDGCAECRDEADGCNEGHGPLTAGQSVGS